MPDWKKTVAGLGVAGAITATVLLYPNGNSTPQVVVDDGKDTKVVEVQVIPDCEAGKVKLEVESDTTGKTTSQLCLSENDYRKMKEGLLGEYEKSKGYDFDINHRELLGAVLNHEIETRGNMSIVGLNDKEKLRSELIDLLR